MAATNTEPLLQCEGTAPLLQHSHFLTNPRAWYRHPSCRIVIAFMVLLMDFLTYGEDPIQDSHVMYNSIGTGQMVGPLAIWYAPTWGYKLGKLGVTVGACLLGYVLGKGFQRLMIKMKCIAFNSGGGLVTSVGLGIVMACFILDPIYNFALGSDEPIKYEIDTHSMEFFQAVFGLPDTTYFSMGKMWQWTSAFADWLAIYQLLDCIFQDKKYWPELFSRSKAIYMATWNGNLRLLIFYIGFPALVILTGVALTFSGNEPGQIDFQIDALGGRTEVGRALAAGIIVFTDLFFFVQDWEFPLFTEVRYEDEEKTRLAGTNSVSLKLCTISISAKWLQYGPMFIVAIFDMLYLKAQFQYTPDTYGEYVNPADNRIWVIQDRDFLNTIYPLGYNQNATLLEQISWSARRDPTTGECRPDVPSCLTDIETQSRFLGTSVDYIGFAVGVASILGFVIVLYFATKKAIEEEHPALKAFADRRKVVPMEQKD